MALHLGSDCPVILSTGSTGVEHRQPSHEWKGFNHPTWNQPDPTIESKSECFKSSEFQNLIACIPHVSIFPGEHWLVGEFFHHRALHCPWFRDPVDDVSPHLAQELRLDVWAMTSPRGVGQKVALQGFLFWIWKVNLGCITVPLTVEFVKIDKGPYYKWRNCSLTLGDFLGFSHQCGPLESHRLGTCDIPRH